MAMSELRLRIAIISKIPAFTMNTTILLAGQAVLIVVILVAVKFRTPITNTINRLISAILRVSANS